MGIRLGKVVVRLRKERGLTQGQLVEFSHGGVSRSSLSLIELGYIEHPSASTLIALANAMRIPLNEFFSLIGYDVRGLLKQHPEEFAPSVVELALRLQALPPTVRDAAVMTFERTLDLLQAAGPARTAKALAEAQGQALMNGAE